MSHGNVGQVEEGVDAGGREGLGLERLDASVEPQDEDDIAEGSRNAESHSLGNLVQCTRKGDDGGKGQGWVRNRGGGGGRPIGSEGCSNVRSGASGDSRLTHEAGLASVPGPVLA